MIDVEAPRDMTDRHRRILAELAELGMEQARLVHQDVVAAETAEQRALASGAFHRISRSVRQSLALEARLERELRLGALREARAAREEAAARAASRRTELQQRVSRMIWSEAEPDEAGAVFRDLEDLLSGAEHFEGFAETPIEDHIARIRDELGLGASAEAEAAAAASRRREALASPLMGSARRYLGINIVPRFVDPLPEDEAEHEAQAEPEPARDTAPEPPPPAPAQAVPIRPDLRPREEPDEVLHPFNTG